MGFSDNQTRALGRNVPARSIRSRTISGKELAYIEGWYALAQANRIFGFDGWDREIVETKCVLAREARGSFTAVYSAKARISIRANDAIVIRDGHGTGEAHGSSAGEVHDRALKAAETDATKRALVTFGKAFGLALYTGERRAQPKQSPRDELNCAKANDGAGISPSGNGRTSATNPPGDITVEHRGVSSEASHTIGTARTPIQNKAEAPGRRIDKSTLAFPEPRRIRDKEHLRYVASQPCLLCSATPSDAHHLRFTQPRAMARKVGDEFTVPLCRAHHSELHNSGNEAAWWHDMGIEPLEIARQLWRETQASQ
jgi:hypothetical protein